MPDMRVRNPVVRSASMRPMALIVMLVASPLFQTSAAEHKGDAAPVVASKVVITHPGDGVIPQGWPAIVELRLTRLDQLGLVASRSDVPLDLSQCSVALTRTGVDMDLERIATTTTRDASSASGLDPSQYGTRTFLVDAKATAQLLVGEYRLVARCTGLVPRGREASLSIVPRARGEDPGAKAVYLGQYYLLARDCASALPWLRRAYDADEGDLASLAGLVDCTYRSGDVRSALVLARKGQKLVHERHSQMGEPDGFSRTIARILSAHPHLSNE